MNNCKEKKKLKRNQQDVPKICADNSYGDLLIFYINTFDKSINHKVDTTTLQKYKNSRPNKAKRITSTLTSINHLSDSKRPITCKPEFITAKGFKALCSIYREVSVWTNRTNKTFWLFLAHENETDLHYTNHEKNVFFFFFIIKFCKWKHSKQKKKKMKLRNTAITIMCLIGVIHTHMHRNIRIVRIVPYWEDIDTWFFCSS